MDRSKKRAIYDTMVLKNHAFVKIEQGFMYLPKLIDLSISVFEYFDELRILDDLMAPDLSYILLKKK